MTTATASFAGRTVFRIGYGAPQLERLHDRRGDAIALLRRAVGPPKATDEPAVHAVAEALGVTPSQVGLAWLLHRAPNVLLIPGIASAAHLEANIAAREITLDAATLASLDGTGSRSNDVPIG